MVKVERIKKRDGRIVDFQVEKITEAVLKAARSVGVKDHSLATDIARQVSKKLETQLKPGEMPHVELVQDLVEKTLIENGQARMAKAYILYRQKRAKIRRSKALLGVTDHLKLPLNAILVLERRYLRKDEKGKVIESTSQMFRRIAKSVAAAERNYGKSDAQVTKYEEEFYRILTRLEFIPNSPTLMNAGTMFRQLSACFVLPIEDSVDSIFNTLKA
ncbi:MAG: ATP cone domain-containing protein, partial [Candidatus Bathyarchaeota archaeon]|nr:ATP cone domain-containing protein [Candidatus Bathyarchaeota archaeon]